MISRKGEETNMDIFMNKATREIGVLDTGVGGLTVAKALLNRLPDECLVYLGDNANCPYGNRSEEEIVVLTKRMLDFFARRDVKMVAIACNTISVLVQKLAADYRFPIVDIITPTARQVAGEGVHTVGVIATVFTTETQSYQKRIEEYAPGTKVHGWGSRTLAAFVDSGNFESDAMAAEIAVCVEGVQTGHPVHDIILGCTHYPIVADLFAKAAPGVRFIDPADAQAAEVERLLAQNHLLANGQKGGFTVYTSGDKAVYANVLKHLHMPTAPDIRPWNED